jgi:L-ascorbate metabolism protein UlaG (beta-lactamase superfamily)
LHLDHADALALTRALGPEAPVLRPEKSGGDGDEVALVGTAESAFHRSGLPQRVLRPWDTVEVGPFTVSALPAADGFGDPQVSWAIAADGCRILHAGDTLFHGWWQLAAMRHGPFDVAFLPAGGGDRRRGVKPDDSTPQKTDSGPCQATGGRPWRSNRRAWQGRRPEGVAAPRRAVEDAAGRGEGQPGGSNVAWYGPS